MGGEGNVTIIRVKGGHRREENNYFQAEASEGGKVTSSEQFADRDGLPSSFLKDL
jgi:hypothetical protein